MPVRNASRFAANVVGVRGVERLELRLDPVRERAHRLDVVPDVLVEALDVVVGVIMGPSESVADPPGHC